MDRKVYEFISQQTNDPIIERKICTVSGTEFPIYQSDKEFYEKISPTFDGKKYQIPFPTLCPEERARRRLTWRNERKLYRRNCDATGKSMISIYSSDKPYKVYEAKERYSDKRDGLEYGCDFDFNTSFFDQFAELMKEVPMLALVGANNENSDYVNLTADSKNCYMLIESSNNEDCYHSYWLQQCERCVDSCFSHGCENCYEIDNCFYCTNLKFSFDCQKSNHSLLLRNCVGCANCFGCINLQNQQYCIFNKQHTKEEYQQFMQDFDKDVSGNLKKYKAEFDELDQTMVRKYAHVYNTENCFADYMNDSKNCTFCVDGYDAENCKYGEHVWRNAKNVMDASTVGRDAEWIYETLNNGISVYHDMFVSIGRDLSHSTYCYSCFNSKHLFGCVGLRNKEYCIFNKQYTKEEYEKKVGEIISYMQTTGERGEFFPITLSPFAYNESIAQEQYPLTHNEIIQKGYVYIDESSSTKIPENMSVVQGRDLQNNISEVTDDILQQIIVCENTGKPFRVISQELDFYRKQNIPLPRKHPDVRHADRMARRKTDFYLRTCDKSGEDIVAIYPSDTPFEVYGEEAYNQEAFG